MDLPNKPDEGVSVETDLSHTRVTLTRMRSSPVLFALGSVAMLALVYGVFGRESVVVFSFSGALGVTAILNALKTEVELGAHAVTIRRKAFSSERATEVVPYDGIRSISTETGRFGRPTLAITRTNGDVVPIRHGNTNDLKTLHRALDARRPIQRVADAEAVPPSLQALRRGREVER